MTKKQQFKWWAYIVGGLILVLFALPAMLSARDTLTVIAGIFLLVLFAVISWHFWIKHTIQFVKGLVRED